MNSVFYNGSSCYLCGSRGTEVHHIWAGRSNRSNSERRGFKVRLCGNCHRALHRHMNSGDSLKLKQMCQRYYEENYGDRRDFIQEFGKSVL